MLCTLYECSGSIKKLVLIDNLHEPCNAAQKAKGTTNPRFHLRLVHRKGTWCELTYSNHRWRTAMTVGCFQEYFFKNFRRDHPVDENEWPVSWKHKMSVSEPPSKRLKMSTEGSQEITDEEYKESMDELNQEYKKSKRERNHATIEQLMKATQQHCRKWIVEEHPLMSEVLDKFPFLASSKKVSSLFSLRAHKF